ncbi:hypothetical protein J2R73_007509 [Bradyrhizobium japonicum]|nr:hypothetical protein [Bradyrhizobium japonicum]
MRSSPSKEPGQHAHRRPAFPSASRPHLWFGPWSPLWLASTMMNRVRYRRVAAIGTCVTRVTKEWDVRPQRLDRVGDHHGSDRALVATSRSALNWGKFLSIPTSYKGTSIVINQTRETTTCTSLAAFDMPEGKISWHWIDFTCPFCYVARSCNESLGG